MYIENRNVFNFLLKHPLSQTPLIQPTPVQFRVGFVRWGGGGGGGGGEGEIGSSGKRP
jgi:hypothetical protein